MLKFKQARSSVYWMLASVFLAVAIGSPQVAQESVANVSVNVLPGQQPDADNPATDQTTLSALSLEAVVVSLFSFHLSHPILPEPQTPVRFAKQEKCSSFSGFLEPLFFFSYFTKVFGKTIAANAP